MPTKVHVSRTIGQLARATREAAHLFVYGASQRRQFRLDLMLSPVGVRGSHGLPLEPLRALDRPPLTIAESPRAGRPLEHALSTHQPPEGGDPHLTKIGEPHRHNNPFVGG